jgi:hypothetical protein
MGVALKPADGPAKAVRQRPLGVQCRTRPIVLQATWLRPLQVVSYGTMTKIDHAACAIAAALHPLGPGSVSRHLDEIYSDQPDAPYGEWCMQIFDIARSLLRKRGEQRLFVMVISISVTDHLVTSAISPAEVTDPITPATFYLLTGDEFFIDAPEEYRATMSAPAAAFATFRSWRSDYDDGPEFNNDIYVWSPFTLKAPDPVN